MSGRFIQIDAQHDLVRERTGNDETEVAETLFLALQNLEAKGLTMVSKSSSLTPFQPENSKYSVKPMLYFTKSRKEAAFTGVFWTSSQPRDKYHGGKPQGTSQLNWKP
jgi:hypothetical protein